MAAATSPPPPPPREPDPDGILARDLDGMHPLVVIVTDDEADIRERISGAIGAGMALRQWSIVRGLSDGRIQSPAVPESEHPAAALAWLASPNGSGRAVTVFHDLARHLDDPRTARALKEAAAAAHAALGAVVLVERTLPPPKDALAEAHVIELPPPSDAEIEAIVREVIQDVRRIRPIDVAIRRSNFARLVRNLRGLSRKQVRRLVTDAALHEHRFDDRDLSTVLVRKRNVLGDLGGVLEFVESPVSLDEIGGLANLKAWLAKRHLDRADEAAAFGLRPPRGVLLLGVQGAGKSLAAKAIATAWSVPLLRLDAGALFDKYIGESERKLRESLEQADRMAPAVLWIDEIEKGFASAASLSSDGGLSRRMFGTLLTWMQERTSPSFLAATANDISALPPELLRKGRFDEVFFVDLPTAEVREKILEIHLGKRKRDPKSFDLARLAAASEGFSGAEIEAAIESAMREAFGDEARALTDADLLQAFASSPPISRVMAGKIGELREWAKGKTVPAE
jgi:AAA+ superfamily predicted ATPase